MGAIGKKKVLEIFEPPSACLWEEKRYYSTNMGRQVQLLITSKTIREKAVISQIQN